MNDPNLIEPDSPATLTDSSDSEHLSAEARSLMANVAQATTAVLNGRHYKVLNLMFLERTENADIAVSKLADVINNLVEDDLILSTLTPLSFAKLSSIAKTHDGIVAYCNVLVPIDLMAEAQRISEGYYHDEAQALNTDTLMKHLPRGQFYCNFHISYVSQSVNGFSLEKVCEEEVSNILRLLPKGTTSVSLRECGITGLSVPYEAIFHNELLSDIKEVEIYYTCRFVEIDGRYKNVRLPIEIRYLARDGETTGL